MSWRLHSREGECSAAVFAPVIRDHRGLGRTARCLRYANCQLKPIHRQARPPSDSQTKHFPCHAALLDWLTK